MTIAYNAALQAAAAALAASGYQTARGGDHHFRTIQSLRETIGADADSVKLFEAFRKKRNITGYERVGLVSDNDADAMYQLATRIRDDVRDWLKATHPHLI